MLSISRSDFFENTAESPSVRVIGIGNAGVHLADRLVMAGANLDVIAMNTDAQSLTSSVCTQKIALGPKATRGLGSGGDPEVGYEAARESADEIRHAVDGINILFLSAGLGGGTGSGITPLIAEAARESGAIVFSIVTSPFSFEGKRRSSQAAEALTEIARHSHAVLHFENDRMAELSSPRAGIEETFAVSDIMLSSAIAGLVGILRGGSPMPVGLGDILAVLGGGTPAGLFGRGEAHGENRAHEALEKALRSPLLDRGRGLSGSHAVLAHISGPHSLSFSETAAVMRELNRHTDDETKLFLGVTTNPDSSAALSVTLFGNYASGASFIAPAPVRRVEPAPAPAPAPTPVSRPQPQIQPQPEPRHEAPAPRPPAPIAEPQEEKPLFPEPEPEERPAIAARQPAPAREPKPAPAPKPAAPPKVKQETLQFEAATRGRFEKSEPTIVEGEDLDVPTFLRMRSKPK